MGKYDKDRHQKELAIRYCLARKSLPFLEVVVESGTAVSDTVELLTDLDVVGIDSVRDGGIHRTIFDCKTLNKVSPISRAFWARGVLDYTSCNYAFVLLKSRTVNNHRFAALSLDVDLHDEASFKSLAQTVDIGFDKDIHYQSSIDRWNRVYDIYVANAWSESLYNEARNLAPLSQKPWNVFRRVIAELRDARTQFDPKKDGHVAIFYDVLSSAFVLWTTLARDLRRFYVPAMKKDEFAKTFRYYIWGGYEAYSVRSQMAAALPRSDGAEAKEFDLPAWDRLVDFAGLTIDAPQNVFDCAYVCRELSIRVACGADEELDIPVSTLIRSNSRVRQFVLAMTSYLVSAAALPSDLNKRVGSDLGAI